MSSEGGQLVGSWLAEAVPPPRGGEPLQAAHGPQRPPRPTSCLFFGLLGPKGKESRPGAKGLKKEKAAERSWAEATRPELPKGQFLPSPGEPCPDTSIFYT